jgi:hypothetical protein
VDHIVQRGACHLLGTTSSIRIGIIGTDLLTARSIAMLVVEATLNLSEFHTANREFPDVDPTTPLPFFFGLFIKFLVPLGHSVLPRLAQDGKSIIGLLPQATTFVDRYVTPGADFFLWANRQPANLIGGVYNNLITVSFARDDGEHKMVQRFSRRNVHEAHQSVNRGHV